MADEAHLPCIYHHQPTIYTLSSVPENPAYSVISSLFRFFLVSRFFPPSQYGLVCFGSGYVLCPQSASPFVCFLVGFLIDPKNIKLSPFPLLVVMCILSPISSQTICWTLFPVNKDLVELDLFLLWSPIYVTPAV